MARTKVLAKADCLGEVVRSFAVNEEINELLIERLDPAAWLANPGPQMQSAFAGASARRVRLAGASARHGVETPGNSAGVGGRTRTIAAIFVHMHHVRRKWIRLSAPQLPLPAELDRECTKAQARKALRASGVLCMEMIEQLLTPSPELTSAPKEKPEFLRDGWARAWPAGPMMVAYMITHEAHHRGQVCMLANQLGFKLPGAVTSAMWGWERLGKH
jgi:uncharacterized damage-inducible protein DinB